MQNLLTSFINKHKIISTKTSAISDLPKKAMMNHSLVNQLIKSFIMQVAELMLNICKSTLMYIFTLF